MFKSNHGNDLGRELGLIEGKLQALEDKLAGLDKKVGEVDDRINKHESKIARIMVVPALAGVVFSAIAAGLVEVSVPQRAPMPEQGSSILQFGSLIAVQSVLAP